MLERLTEYPELLKLYTAVQARCAASVLDWSLDRGELAVRVRRDALLEVLRFLKEEQGFSALNDLIALDNLRALPEGGRRFAVLYQLFRFPEPLRLRVRVDVGEEETVDSAVPVYPAADWAEREAYDMFGIRFAGHPDLKRIYMPDDWDGFPLRKDYPLEGKG